ncbi:hypothetical protein F5148DRAFT_1335174 [Russula earlei]|uniref:Uncharacterized protein n=1 Tax=Russula earlei TaxID=71964 RepID=A0ACC0TWL2_9AGAM|nr:hypothetical protein F5148DRAFT_1335174 [Russula earlei]
MHAACDPRVRAGTEAMYGGNVWRQGSTVVGGGAICRGGGGGEVRVRNIPCEGMSMCLMPGVVSAEGFDNLGMEEAQGRMVVWSGSRGMDGKHEFIGISIGSTGGIEMAILTGAVGGTAGAKTAEVVAGNMVDRAEAPKYKAEMVAAVPVLMLVLVMVALPHHHHVLRSWRTEVGMDEAKTKAVDGEMVGGPDTQWAGQQGAIIQSSVLLWHLGNILKLLESLLECLGERDGTQQLHHLGKEHQSVLVQPRVRTRTLKMSICLVASSKQHFVFNLHPQQPQQELC